ncbi:hypothetical protein [Pedobacter nutrimenti]|uniref:hypothetical protein n=1 Tax=Pedobacter nutrimenti TaxID=1241337 RepID=UPI00292FC6E5|nr:hypothetical protein [Pedobacter nutrimenti]
MIICLIGSTSLIVILYFISNKGHAAENGFIRLLPSHKLIGVISQDIRYNIWYIAGTSNGAIYFGNNIVPGRISKVDTSMVNYQEINLFGFEKMQVSKGSFIQIDSPFFYFLDGVKPVILRGSVSDCHLSKQLNSTTYFTGGIPLTKNSFALRSVYNGLGNKLIKQSIKPGSLKATSLLEKQVDGMFCTDGEMVKIPGSSKMIYVYYYRNQFLCADSNLNLLYKGKTIDTISHAQIKVARIKSSGEITMAAPPLYVNKRACANEKYLFVQSALRANNETDYMIKDVSMIDVYAVKDGKYQFSFYLPDFRGFKVRDFKIYGQSLYALYDHYLYKYQLNF